ncbi:LuxR C-terminal-related transcriptional regulator [Ornithinimicrobium sp. F0845]|uniref:LuxR C-terminal-related transcriptional regulator n=1 Tax=Ornithinimicrobium sp. F0845 TaxID=2926412 RepID=UPI001FF65DE6|nr:LuxR C-terminal-related transcriptional regulator [Ornithinimicrobium sp. F0845]MCK0113589.1 LuxR C-terminal-related transcriptional regulator [Ornithinimicrobium sp. F0845]
MLSDSPGDRAFVTPARLRVPSLSQVLVGRDRLVEKAIGHRRVTLVCAPAGAGKTLLLADWATRAQARAESVAWLSLEPLLDRPYEFWSAVIEALMVSGPETETARLDALSPPRNGVEPRFITALIDVVVEWGSACLVLDDVHVLQDEDVLAGLDVLLTQAPAQFRVVMAGRSEPTVSLHRLRLDASLAEVVSTDLVFTEAEAADLFAALGTRLNSSEVARLVARTEGWAAGLRLAATSVEGTESPAAFIAAFEGDHRAVADYLFAEVIQHLAEDLVEFLRATCAPEEISVELAAHLSGREDAGELLDRLCRSNALVVQAGESSWYRYHSLLRGYLMAALRGHDVDAPRRQHLAAAHWFDRHDEPTVALTHAAQAADDDLIGSLLRRHGLRMVLSGRSGLILDALGDRPSAPLLADESVRVAAALAALDVGDLAATDQWLSRLAVTPSTSDPRLVAMRASAIVQRALLGGDVEGALTTTGILDLAETGEGDVDLIMLAYRAPARIRTGDYQGVLHDLERALALARAHRYDQFVLWTLAQMAGITGAICDIRASREWAELAIAFAERRGWADSPRLAYAYLMASWSSFQTGDHEAQARHAENGLLALDGVNNVEVEVGVRSMHAVATFEASSGPERRAAAQQMHAIWDDPLVDQVSPALVSQATPQEIRLALGVGHPEWAEVAVARIQERMPDTAEGAAARAQLLTAKGRVRDALMVLSPVLAGSLPAHAPTTLVHAQVLAAGLEATQGNDHRAFDAVRAALDWSAPQSYVRPFMDAWADIEAVLARHRGRFGAEESFVTHLFEHHGPRDTGPALTQTLSTRELEVLRDLPSLLTVSEIAEAEAVSRNTVKSHIRSIYQKLGVDSRSAAVREARDRGLL